MHKNQTSPSRTRLGTIFKINMSNNDNNGSKSDAQSPTKETQDPSEPLSEWKTGLESQVADLAKQMSLMLIEMKTSLVPSPSQPAPVAIANSSVSLGQPGQTGGNSVPTGQSLNLNANSDPRPSSGLTPPPLQPPLQPPLGSPARKQLSQQDINANFLTFSSQNPATWFSVTENRFDYLEITSDEEKYWITLKCLGPTYFDELQAFMPSLQTGNKYPALKAEILRKLAQSEHDKLDRLLRESSMGERSPSEYFNTVQSLAAGIMSKDAALRFWWKGLPTDIAISIDLEIVQLNSAAAVEKANRIAEFKRSKEVKSFDHSIASVEGTRLVGTNSEVLTRIEALEKRDMRSRQAKQRRFERSGYRDRSKSSNRDEETERLCFYHYEFGDKARRCRKPCAWQRKQPAQGNETDSVTSKKA